MEGLENILKVGQDMMQQKGLQENEYATFVEDAGGLTKLDDLQGHENEDIFSRAVKILEKYFGAVVEDDVNTAPQVGQGGQFAFGGAPQAPQASQGMGLPGNNNGGGFNFQM